MEIIQLNFRGYTLYGKGLKNILNEGGHRNTDLNKHNEINDNCFSIITVYPLSVHYE